MLGEGKVGRYPSGGPPGPSGGGATSLDLTPLSLRSFRILVQGKGLLFLDDEVLSYGDLLGLARQYGLDR